MRIFVHASPGAKIAEVVPLDEPNHFRVRINAPAKENKANIRLLEIIAEHFKVSQSMVKFVSGVSSKDKILEVG